MNHAHQREALRLLKLTLGVIDMESDSPADMIQALCDDVEGPLRRLLDGIAHDASIRDEDEHPTASKSEMLATYAALYGRPVVDVKLSKNVRDPDANPVTMPEHGTFSNLRVHYPTSARDQLAALKARRDVASSKLLDDGRYEVVDDVGATIVGSYAQVLDWLRRGLEDADLDAELARPTFEKPSPRKHDKISRLGYGEITTSGGALDVAALLEMLRGVIVCK